jgi:hypothetical protein
MFVAGVFQSGPVIAVRKGDATHLHYINEEFVPLILESTIKMKCGLARRVKTILFSFRRGTFQFVEHDEEGLLVVPAWLKLPVS